MTLGGYEDYDYKYDDDDDKDKDEDHYDGIDDDKNKFE